MSITPQRVEMTQRIWLKILALVVSFGIVGALAAQWAAEEVAYHNALQACEANNPVRAAVVSSNRKIAKVRNEEATMAIGVKHEQDLEVAEGSEESVRSILAAANVNHLGERLCSVALKAPGLKLP